MFYFLRVLYSGSGSLKGKTKVDERDPRVLRQWNVLPLSITVGFLLPTYLMVSTSFSGETHQLFTRLWAFFPLYVLVTQEAFVFVATLIAPKKYDESKVHLKEVWWCHNFTWLFGIRFACFFYLPGLAVLLLVKFTPGLFKDEVLESINWTRLYSLPSLNGSQKVSGLQEGMFGLMLWDGFVGGMSGVLYALWNVAEARREKVCLPEFV